MESGTYNNRWKKATWWKWCLQPPKTSVSTGLASTILSQKAPTLTILAQQWSSRAQKKTLLLWRTELKHYASPVSHLDQRTNSRRRTTLSSNKSTIQATTKQLSLWLMNDVLSSQSSNTLRLTSRSAETSQTTSRWQRKPCHHRRVL